MQRDLAGRAPEAPVPAWLEKARAARIRAFIYACHPAAFFVYAAIAYAIVAVFYFDASDEVDHQQARIDESQAILAEPLPDIATLESDLLGWEWSRDLARDSRIDRSRDSSILDIVLALAFDHGLEPFSSGVRDDSTAIRNDVDYRSTPFFLKATGELEDIELFLEEFELGAVPSAEIQHNLVTTSDAQFVIEIDALALSEFPASAIDGTPDPTAEDDAGEAVSR